jgi:hypothetical protein
MIEISNVEYLATIQWAQMNFDLRQARAILALDRAWQKAKDTEPSGSCGEEDIVAYWDNVAVSSGLPISAEVLDDL